MENHTRPNSATEIPWKRLLVLFGAAVLLLATGFFYIALFYKEAVAPNGPRVGSAPPRLMLPAFGKAGTMLLVGGGDEVICIYRTEYPYCKRVLPEVIGIFVRSAGRAAGRAPQLVLVQQDNETYPSPEVMSAGWHGVIYKDPQRQTEKVLSAHRVPMFLVYHDGMLRASYLGVSGWQTLQSTLQPQVPTIPVVKGPPHFGHEPSCYTDCGPPL